ncbi:MAG: hypothetical protein WB783_11560 [Arenicellales bacterium]
MLILACVAAILTALAAVQWWSWHQLSASTDYVRQLATTGWIDDEPTWQRYRRSLHVEALLEPQDARVYWQLGELAYWQAAGLRLWPERQREAMETARRYYLRAVGLAPSDGVLLARVSHRLVESDRALAVTLMRRAMDVAPFEPLVEYELADVGLQVYDGLDEPMKRSFERMLAHAMQNYRLAPKIKRMARDDGRPELLVQLGSAATD